MTSTKLSQAMWDATGWKDDHELPVSHFSHPLSQVIHELEQIDMAAKAKRQPLLLDGDLTHKGVRVLFTIATYDRMGDDWEIEGLSLNGVDIPADDMDYWVEALDLQPEVERLIADRQRGC